ncbi:hypothetical protein P7C70_g3233, partial [Phenoliferia sp. Uapishka_3]
MNNFANTFKSFQSTVSTVAGQTAQGLSGAVASVDLNKATRGFQNLSQNLTQTVRERAGTATDVTELPQEYLDLERRVDGLKAAHVGFLKVARVYSSETYDYPVQIQESVSELGGNIAHLSTTYWAAATKGTQLPQTAVAEKPVDIHKTLPHALSRAANAAAIEVGPSRLSNVLKSYSAAQEFVGTASKNFIQPWSATLNSSLQAAIKSRQNVKSARISLDACRGTLTHATGGPKQEQARMEVEAAEEKLVNATEEAINLMRAVLENPEPIKNLASMIKAQQAYHAKAAEALFNIQAEVEEANVQADADYRKSRAQ